MKKVFLIAVLGQLCSVVIAQTKKAEFLKINLSCFSNKEDPESKVKPAFAGNATLIKGRTFSSIEYEEQKTSVTAGYGGVIKNETVFGLGLNATSAPSFDHSERNVLFGIGGFLNHEVKKLDIEISSHFAQRLADATNNWSQNLFSLEIKTKVQFSKLIQAGLWAHYSKLSNKEPMKYLKEYTLLEETYHKYSENKYTEDRNQFKCFVGISPSEHVSFIVGPQFNQYTNLLHTGMSRGLKNTRQHWAFTGIFVSFGFDL